eukprot:scaffold107884_cov44-Cyclotella_meneghiniana.AAC.3
MRKVELESWCGREQGLLPEIYPTPDTRSDRVYPTTYPISLVPDVEIPEYLPEHGLGQCAIPGYLPEESNYSGSKPWTGT